MCSSMKRQCILILLYMVGITATTTTTSSIEKYVLTGPPKHGDMVYCWEQNTQIVLSGGVCHTHLKRARSNARTSYGDTSNIDVQNITKSIISLHPTVECGEFHQRYYPVGMAGGCMISTNKLSIVEEIRPHLTGHWNNLNFDNYPSSSNHKKLYQNIFTTVITLFSILYNIFN